MNTTMTYAPKVSDSVVAEISTSQKIADIFKTVGLKKSPKPEQTYLCELNLSDKVIHALANEESLAVLFDDLDDYGKVRIWDLMKGLNVSYVVDHKGWKFCVVITYNPNSIAFKAKRLWVHRKFLKAQGIDAPVIFWYNAKESHNQNCARLASVVAKTIAELKAKTPNF